MQTTENNVVKERIDTLDLEPIKFKLVKEHGYSTSQANILEKWYKRFLFLTFKYQGQPIVVSEVIDTFWHQHILDTRKYADDCQYTFGDFLHHFPYFGLRGDDDQRALQNAYASTLELMISEYGESPESELKGFGAIVRGLSGDTASGCSDCGGTWPDDTSIIGDQRPRLAK